MQLRHWAKIIAMIALCCGVGFSGVFFTKSSISDWYADLIRPPLTPPSWTFGVIWPVLYILMGTSAGILWNKPIGQTAVRRALWLFVFQLLLNGLWTPLFFGLHRIDWALIEISLLWVSILATVIVFHIQSKPAGLLLLPYLAWVSFAVYLNAGFWYLNK